MDVSVNLLRGCAGVLRELGIGFEPVMEEAGISRDQLARTRSMIELSVAERLLGAALRASGERGLGLDLGDNVPMQSLGMLGEVLLHAPTLRAALEVFHEYLPLLFPLARFRLQEDGERALLAFDPPFADPEGARFCVELTFTLATRIGRRLTPGMEPLEVRVQHAAPPYANRYSTVMDCPVRFGAPQNELVFPCAALDRPQPFVDEPLWRLLRRRADELLAQQRARELLHERVKQVLRHEVDLGDVNPANIARRLGVSPRSLRRRLGDEGHSLSALTDEVRREVALSELTNPDIPIKRIADRVGFSEVSAFHRAFKRWTGVTPARYRAQAFLARAS